MSENFGQYTFMPDSDTLAAVMERQAARRREDHAQLLESLRTAVAEKDALEDADRASHRLWPVAEWCQEVGEVIRYQVSLGGTVDLLGAGFIYPGDGTTHWIALPDPEKLWIL